MVSKHTAVRFSGATDMNLKHATGFVIATEGEYGTTTLPDGTSEEIRVPENHSLVEFKLVDPVAEEGIQYRELIKNTELEIAGC